MEEHIKIADIAPRIQYTGDGTQSAFAYPFPVFNDADLKIYVDGVLQTLSTDYAVTGSGNSSGGIVTFTTPPATALTVTLVRELSVARTTDFQESGEFRAKVINDELDRLIAMIQETGSRLTRTLRLAETDGDATLALPDKTARANTYLGFNASGDIIAAPGTDNAVPVSAFGATLIDDADAVSAHATLGLVIGTDVLAPTGDASQLVNLPASGGGYFKGENGTTGTSAGDIFRVNEQELNTDVSIAATENAQATGPLSIATGITLSVASGGTLVIS